MTTDTVVTLVALAAVAWVLIYPPIFKPWFGLRKPKGHSGRWGQ